MTASNILSFDSEEGGFVSFEKVDDKLVIRVGRQREFLEIATIPGEAVEHLACFAPQAAA